MRDWNRRGVIGLVGGAAAWSVAARAQQSTMPVIGFLNALGQNDTPSLPAAFRRGLGETGYIEARNTAIEYRLQKIGTIDCLPLRPIWSAARST